MRSDPRSTGPGYPLEDPDIRWVQDEVREFEFNEGSYIDISLGQAVIKDISRSCGDECSYPTTIAHFCIAPVVQTCGEGASVAAADCAAARNLCLQRGLTPPACRPAGIFETALARGLMVDYSSAGLDYPRMNDEVEAGPMCTGDCDDDSDCDAGLLCYQRDFTFNTPPGCRPQVSADECEDPLNECDVVDNGATQTFAIRELAIRNPFIHLFS